ncbi:Centromeric protein E, putative [Pediculus humanus corporis]|uniref:Centromeric protein E, putative n=1 Tax=Pediculus humanus subsp. corporis TaxID=121224 RepID=E0VUT3_PEDHC|nr:Centromeric protein E, putative [Pediculus humanus corporis]EEB17139.1 Centromeric protein E, putative [Pediculus humanus corporis]
MHHSYTSGKGDPLCPLGFHPQVRWPTRCKRCFRDYKEHGGKGKTSESGLVKDDKTRSTPSLSSWNTTTTRNRDFGRTISTASITSDVNSKDETVFNGQHKPTELNTNFSTSQSLSSSAWTSTPDLGNIQNEVSTTVSVTLPRRRRNVTDNFDSSDATNKPTEFTIRRRTYTTDLSQVNVHDDSTTVGDDKHKTDSDKKSKVKLTDKHEINKGTQETKISGGKPPGKLKRNTITTTNSNGYDSNSESHVNPDVEFILRVKASKHETSKKEGNLIKQSSSVLIPPHTSSSSSSSGPDEPVDDEDDVASIANTETTETTLVGKNDSELLEEIESLKIELEQMKTRCEKVEREKSDILLRRLASFDTTSTKTAASEVLKLQQKLNELSNQSEDLKDDNKSLSLRVKELEKELEEQKNVGNAGKRAEELQAKLAAAETLCEELMDENEEMKKELRELEDEIEEMQDNFREDQADEYSSLKKELEQSTKNCRILSFKLRKAERKSEELEAEKLHAEMKLKEVSGSNGLTTMDKIKKLEGELKISNELSTRLTKELEEANKRLKKFENNQNVQTVKNNLKPGGTEKVPRASLMRGGSQEDPQQLLRDLQDSLEREADLKEQLRFAEEEAANLRKKAARVEEDNDSLALQLKKMATKAKSSRKNSPSTNTRTPKPVIEKDEGISDEEDPTELRLLLDLNEQESAVLRKKVEKLEADLEAQEKKMRDLEEKLASCKKSGDGFKKTSSGTGNLFDNDNLKASEEKINELKKKLLEKENELEKMKKNQSSSPIKKQITKTNQQLIKNLKKQLEMVEQEAIVLRTKLNALESDNEKLTAENKKLILYKGTKKLTSSNDENVILKLEQKLKDSEKQVKELNEKLQAINNNNNNNNNENTSTTINTSETDKLKKDLKLKMDEIDKLTKEIKNKDETLKRLREDGLAEATEFYKNRKPKKPTDLTTKIQLKKMIQESENDISDLLVLVKNYKFQTKNEKSNELEEKNKLIKELNDKIEEMKNVKDEEIKKLNENIKKLKKEKEGLKTEMNNNLKEEKENSILAQEEIKIFAKKLEVSNKELEEERENVRKYKKQLENFDKLEKDKGQLEKDLIAKEKETTEVKNKLTEVEEKLRKAEKNLTINRKKVSNLEKNVEEIEEIKNSQMKKCQSLESEILDLKNSNTFLKTKISELEDEIKKDKTIIKDLENSIREEREKATDECLKAGSLEKKEIMALRDDLSKKTKQLDELTQKLETSEKERKSLEENIKKTETKATKDKEIFESKISSLEKDLNAEKRNGERIKITHDKEEKNREMELSALKSKIKTLEQSTNVTNKKMADLKEEWTFKIKELEKEVSEEKKKYEDLTTKYEILEEEHVVTKAQLVMEKEQAQSQVGINKKDIVKLETELQNLQDTLLNRQETWMKEKKELQEKIKENSQKTLGKWELEKSKLQALADEQKSLAEQLRQQNKSVVEQMEHMRKENEELRKKLDDFDKVSKIHKQMSADTSQLEMQLREAQTKLAVEEKNYKTDMAALKLRYENRVNLISGELQASQNHLSRFKRERDNYKHMLEEAQMQMANLKKGSQPDVTGELKDSKTAMAVLEQQISCMEDELTESRLECSKLKTELVSEKSAWEVKISELQSKINELEEEKILSSGRTKIVGLRTKMELSWQKEREDQQRLLQETSALARDLRQTLYEVERERDKVKLESKRTQEQVKRASEEEMEENRKKITELQCDLLELRDAHAKLRTTNEKLRRETERWNRENRSLQKSKIKTEEEERKVQLLLDNIDLLLKATFEKKTTGRYLESSSSSKKRAGSKSRESSPLSSTTTTTTTGGNFPQDEIQLILQRLSETAEDIRLKTQSDDRFMDERSKRASSVGYRSLRAASTESDFASETSTVTKRPINKTSKKSNLHRKSLSLSETTGPGAQDQMIWREDNDNDGSLTSLEDHTGSRYKNINFRENSMDSRLSGGSTQSEFIGGEKKKKKKGLFGKLKKLTKSKSIDDTTGSHDDLMRGGESDSDMSTVGDVKGTKKHFKEKFSEMFKKDAQSKNSTSKSSKNLQRASPDPTSKSTSLGRPLDTTTRNPVASSMMHKP